MGTLSLTKEAKIYNGGNTASSKVVLGKLDSCMENNAIKTFSNTIYRNKLKMDSMPKWETGYY